MIYRCKKCFNVVGKIFVYILVIKIVFIEKKIVNKFKYVDIFMIVGFVKIVFMQKYMYQVKLMVVKYENVYFCEW